MYKITILLISTFFAIGHGQDPCTFYSPIFDRRRSPDYTIVPGQDVISDIALFEGWYRFTNGLAKMPESCVKRNRCGTFNPIWLCGHHPTKPGEITTATACANTGQGQNCCGYPTNNIQVKHCGSFYVYRLRPVPLYMAYCAGGDNSPSKPQAMTQGPTLDGPFRSNRCGNSDIYTDFLFKCRVNYPTDVTWLIDGKSINKTTSINGCPWEASISGSELIPYMGHTLSCAAGAQNNSQNNNPSLKSNAYWMGMRITSDPNRLEVHENSGTAKPVKLVSTVPIVCHECPNDGTRPSECYVDYILNTTDVRTPSCNIRLSYSQWNEARKTAETTMNVIADKDFINDGDRVETITAEPNMFTGAHHIFWLYKPEGTQVATKDSATPACRCWGDPHCHTFDKDMNGSGDEFNMYKAGRFIMAQTKNESLFTPPFQVEIQTQNCSDVSCICGVVAREGNDAVEINYCPDTFHSNKGEVHILSPQHFNKTKVDDEGKHVMIFFPSGRSVEIDKATNTITNVIVRPRSDDANNIEGLCGSFNGRQDELVHRNGTVETFKKRPDEFVESWRIPKNTSMSERGEITYNPRYDPRYDRYTRFCTCHLEKKSSTVDCDHTKHRERLLKLLLPNSQDRTQAIWRSSMAAGPPQRIPYPLYDYEEAFVPKEPRWPTPSGLHEADVIRICQDAMSKIEGLNKCQTIAKMDFQGIIDMCIEDIKISDDIKLTQVATQIAMGKCIDFVTKDTVLFSANSTEEFIQDLLCAGDCSGNGNCTNGTCVCNNSFIGDDCSLDSSKAPFVSKILSGDQCDIKKSPCEAVYVSGSNFYDGSSSSCHLLELNFNNGSFEETGQVYHTDVDYITATNVGCFLPTRIFVNGKSTVAYTFSITNDRTLYSQNKTVIVYDSACLDCYANFTCKIKPQFCLIDGNCYSAKEAKPGDSSYTCDPKLSNTQWTNQRMAMLP